MSEQFSIVITGVMGRMGQAIASELSKDSSLKLAGATERPLSPALGQKVGDVVINDSLEAVLSKEKVSSIIDFTTIASTIDNLSVAQKHNVPMVIGTTGFKPDHLKTIQAASKQIPIVLSPNMSVGVNTMLGLIAKAAEILGNDFDIEVVEAHHRLKVDSPSGTAVKIGEVLAEATGLKYPDHFNFHREGIIGARPQKQIGMQVIRGGDIVGEHTVMYCGNGERLEIKHVATSRNTFAGGALRAAKWLAGQKPGLYSMKDVLGLY